MDFALFLLLNATLFIRPAEIVPDLIGLPIYNGLMLLNLAAAFPKIARRLSTSTLKSEPITACVLGLWACIGLSHAPSLNFSLIYGSSVEFGKIVLYFLLLVAVLDSPARLKRFLAAMVVFVSILTALALAQYHGAIDIPSLRAVGDHGVDPETGEEVTVMRLCSTGIYNDPNDLSLILILGSGLCLFLAGAPPGGLPRPYWVAPIGLFLYALTLTHSRGGFLALLAGMLSLFYGRFGARKAAMLSVVALPVMFALFAGRQTEISTSNNTGQDRIQLWAAGFAMFRQSPLFGVGQNTYQDHAGLVAHNSFIHAFAELGFPGGCLYLGQFAYAIRTLLALADHAGAIVDPDLRRLRPYLLAIVAGYSFGTLTLSRNYVVPTFLILALAQCYFRLALIASPNLSAPGGPIASSGRRLVVRMMLIGVAFLVAANLFIKLFVQW